MRIEKSCWQDINSMIIWKSTAENGGTTSKLTKKISKKVLKSCWQTEKHMILYQSCVWELRRQRMSAKCEAFRIDPWQINSNATLKIPTGYRHWKLYLKRKFRTKFKEKSENTTKKVSQWKLAGQTLKYESLILAQDERWRRA